MKQTLRIIRCSNERLSIHRTVEDPNGGIKHNQISWRIPEIESDPKTLTELTKHILDKKSFPIHFSGRYCESLEINAWFRQLSWRVALTSLIEKPRWIFVGLQSDRNTT